MSEQELDPQVIAAIERAARGNPELRSAASAISAALTRRDEREREAWAIVQWVAAIPGACCPNGACGREHAPDCPVTRARRLLGGGENDG